MEDLVDLSDDVDTYGDGEEDVADDEDRAGVFQAVTRTFGDGSNGLEKSDLAKDGDNYHSGESSPEVTDIEAFAKVFFGVERKLGGRAISNKNTVTYCSIAREDKQFSSLIPASRVTYKRPEAPRTLMMRNQGRHALPAATTNQPSATLLPMHSNKKAPLAPTNGD
ncbi:hypothetical protein NC651_034737 [Populus alba x Populus x berolinensis]|nr:hypothetical protein NC651_034737 [Populus alba x Populus x berolinensis]